MNEEKIIDLREKTDKEIFETYKDIAQDTMIADEVFNKIKNIDEALKVYEEIKSKHEEKENE